MAAELIAYGGSIIRQRMLYVPFRKPGARPLLQLTNGLLHSRGT